MLLFSADAPCYTSRLDPLDDLLLGQLLLDGQDHVAGLFGAAVEDDLELVGRVNPSGTARGR